MELIDIYQRISFLKDVTSTITIDCIKRKSANRYIVSNQTFPLTIHKRDYTVKIAGYQLGMVERPGST